MNTDEKAAVSHFLQQHGARASVGEGCETVADLVTKLETQTTDGEGLDERWVITPVGGVDKVPTFITLLGGNQLNIAVVLDGAAGGSPKVNNLIQRGMIDAKAVVALATATGGKSADIEDMFDISWYLALAKASGAVAITKSKLAKGDRIVQRIEDVKGGFNHYRPAAHLLREQATLSPKLDSDTSDRFEDLFMRINPLLS